MIIIFPIISYLIGSILFGYVLVKTIKGIDIREHGSKNVGATNTWRVAGKQFGIAAFVLDMLKGFLPVFFVYRAFGETTLDNSDNIKLGVNSISMICGVAAILGHIFPIFLRFKGGKAAATSCGVFLFFAPLSLAIAIMVWTLTVFISKYVSLATMLASISFVISVIFIDKDPFGASIGLTTFSIIMCIAIIILHRSNIKRIINGTENRIKSRKMR